MGKKKGFDNLSQLWRSCVSTSGGDHSRLGNTTTGRAIKCPRDCEGSVQHIARFRCGTCRLNERQVPSNGSARRLGILKSGWESPHRKAWQVRQTVMPRRHAAVLPSPLPRSNRDNPPSAASCAHALAGIRRGCTHPLPRCVRSGRAGARSRQV